MAETKPASGRPWRRWLAALHRDLGYLAAGTTLVYALSGLALNHRAHWNPSYRNLDRTFHVAPIATDLPEARVVAEALARLGEREAPKNTFQPDAETLQVFFAQRTYTLDLPTGKVLVQGLQPRPVLHTLNLLHRNGPRGPWTWIADAYAATLLFLALSGLFILKGRFGLKGRGGWLTAAGVALPLVVWAWWSLRA